MSIQRNEEFTSEKNASEREKVHGMKRRVESVNTYT
jgi:hypothetical protein